MPFKKTKNGYEYDPNGEHRIPTRRGLYDRPIPKPQVLDEFGHPVDADDEYWRKVIEEANGKD